MTLPPRDAYGRFVHPGGERTTPPRRDAHGRFVSDPAPESTVPLVIRGPAEPWIEKVDVSVARDSDRWFLLALIAVSLLILCAAIAVTLVAL